MVSKVAVMALVGILAIPILLGYGLNLTETSETRYEESGESVNVTDLLQTGTDHSYAHGDIVSNNTTFGEYYLGNVEDRYYPQYQKNTATRTAFRGNYISGSIGAGSVQSFSGFNLYYVQVLSGSLSITVYVQNGGQEYVAGSWSDVKSVLFIRNSPTSANMYIDNGTHPYYEDDNITKMVFNSTVSAYQFYDNVQNRYIDLSAGFRINTSALVFSGNMVYLPVNESISSILLTINLGSITDSNYEFSIGMSLIRDRITLTKTTTGGIVSWTATRYNFNTPIETFDLYYDQTRSDNTYQFQLQSVFNRSVGVSDCYNDYYAQLRYIGGWPAMFGEQNYYQLYEFQPWEERYASPNSFMFNDVGVIEIQVTNGGYTPIMRVDDTYFKAFDYAVIKDKTYDPAAFRENPVTTIKDPFVYGSSITFGGNTYAVNDGNIRLGSHDIPIKNIKFSSVPNENGGYDNMIGKTIVSNTVSPSTITFGGSWSAIVTTIGQSETTYTKTEWIPGQFAWDGIDDNFLIVGLITCLGVFIGLGIYARSHRMSIWPLLLVCGGAAALFIFMI